MVAVIDGHLLGHLGATSRNSIVAPNHWVLVSERQVDVNDECDPETESFRTQSEW